jgi:hypothetical protein
LLKPKVPEIHGLTLFPTLGVFSLKADNGVSSSHPYILKIFHDNIRPIIPLGIFAIIKRTRDQQQQQ